MGQVSTYLGLNKYVYLLLAEQIYRYIIIVFLNKTLVKSI